MHELCVNNFKLQVNAYVFNTFYCKTMTVSLIWLTHKYLESWQSIHLKKNEAPQTAIQQKRI